MKIGFEAGVEHVLMRDGWRLYLWRYIGDNRSEILMETGTWATVESAEIVPTAGLFLPGDSWNAIRKLAAPHADAGEVKALREALALEQARVDRFLDWNLR